MTPALVSTEINIQCNQVFFYVERKGVVLVELLIAGLLVGGVAWRFKL